MVNHNILKQRSLIEAQLAEVSARAQVSAAEAALDLQWVRRSIEEWVLLGFGKSLKPTIVSLGEYFQPRHAFPEIGPSLLPRARFASPNADEQTHRKAFVMRFQSKIY